MIPIFYDTDIFYETEWYDTDIFLNFYDTFWYFWINTNMNTDFKKVLFVKKILYLF